MGEFILTWWPVLSVILGGLLSGLGIWAAWSARKQFVTTDEFEIWCEAHEGEHDKITKDLSDGAAEFRVIKAELEHLPSRQDIEETVDRAVAPLVVSINGVRSATEGIQDLVQTLLSHELAEARDAKAKAKGGM